MPKFIFGYSLGGLISVKLSNVLQKKVNGVALVNPYFGLRHESEQAKFDKLVPFAKLLNKFIPSFSMK